MAKFEDYIEKTTLNNDDLILLADSADLDSEGDYKTKKFLGSSLLNNTSNSMYNILIDGDFNHNQMGGTGSTSTGAYIIDVWRQAYTSGTLTSTISAEIDSDIRKNKIAFALSSSEMALAQRLAGVNIMAGSTISIFVKISSTAGVSNLEARVTQNFGTGGSASVVTDSSTQNVTAGTSETWYRFDVAVPSIAGKTIGANNYVQVQISTDTAQTADITFFNMRAIYKPTNLASGVIPDWIKYSEDPETTKLRKFAYYWQSFDGASAATTNDMYTAWAISTSNFYGGNNFFYAVPMVKAPTVTTYSVSTGDVGKFYDATGAGDVNSTVGAAGKQNVFVYGNTTLTVGRQYRFHLKADARF